MTSALQSALRRTLRRASLVGALASAAFVAPSAQTPQPAPAPATRTGQTPAAGTSRHAARAAGHLPGRDRVRRSRRRRHRRARQPGQGPHQGGFRRLRRRRPAEGVVLLADRDPGRAPRSVRQRVAADRAGRPLERPAVRRPHLRAAPRQPPHRRAAQRPGQAGGARVRRQVPRRQRRRRRHPHLRRHRRVAGVHQRSAAAARLDRPLHRPEAALAHAGAPGRVQPQPAAAAAGQQQRRHSGSADRPRHQGPRPARRRTRLLRPLDARDAAQPGRFHGLDPRPAQGDPDVQRGHRLSDLRRLRFARRLDDPERHARRHRLGLEGQRELLHDRPARPARDGRREHGAGRLPGRSVLRHQPAGVRRRAAAVGGQPQGAGRADRRLRGRREQRLQQRLRPHRPREQLATTCSATTRRATSATAGSTRSR